MPTLAPGDYISIISTSYTAVRKLIDVVKSIKNAPKEIRAVKREAAFVAHLLGSIRGEESQKPSTPKFWPLVEEMAETLQEDADKFVTKVTKARLESGGIIKRALWPAYASEAKDLTKLLKEFHATVGAAYSVGVYETLQSLVYTHFTPIMQEVHAVNTTLSSMKQTIIHVTTSAPDPYPSDLYPDGSERDIRHAGEEERTTSSSLSRRSARNGRRMSSRSGGGACWDEDQWAEAGAAGRRRPKSCGHLRQLVPRGARSVFGDISACPGCLIAAIVSAVCPCDNESSTEMRAAVAIVTWCLPGWCAEISATVRLRSCPVQIIIQTPRRVQEITFDDDLTLDGLKSMMATREVTVNDVTEDGFSLLHWLTAEAAKANGISEVCEMIQYVIEMGARTDWECNGWTPAQYGVAFYALTDEPVKQELAVLERTVLRPLFDADTDELWEDICDSVGWTDLHSVIVKRWRCPATLAEIEELLQQPRYRSQLNTRHRDGWGPLRYAIRSRPDAVEVLLRAGADPRSDGTNVNDTVYFSSMTSISSLIRTGVDIEDHQNRPSPLHSALTKGSGYALEVLRHGSHLIDWEYRDCDGRTPLDAAKHRMGEWYWNKDLPLIAELYQARKLPIDAQLIDKDDLDDAAQAIVGLQSTSLIAAGLDRNIPGIGELIRLGAMVNERDHAGRTLLHLVAMGIVRDGYRVALEVVRHGGYGVNWAAFTVDGETAEELAEDTVRLLKQSDTSSDEALTEAVKILELLRSRRLPDGEAYIYPCMHPKFCRRCSSYPCTGVHPRPGYRQLETDCQCGCSYGDENGDPTMPGAWIG